MGNSQLCSSVMTSMVGVEWIFCSGCPLPVRVRGHQEHAQPELRLPKVKGV